MTESTKSPIELARERIALAEARRVERDTKAQAAIELAALERQATEAEALDTLELEHGKIDDRIRRIDTPGGMVVVKRPAGVLVRRYLDAGKATTEAWDKLVTPCVIYPDKATFRALCDDFPATLQLAADAVCWLAGWGREQAVGK
jgi:hypothetical protein